MSNDLSDSTVRAATYDEFAVEWDAVHGHVRQSLLDALHRLGVSAGVVEYVSGMRLYMRVSFLLSLWIDDATCRQRVSVALGMHIVAMKLFDDLVDADTPYERIDLAASLQLSNVAAQALCGLSENPQDIMRILANDFEYISRGQIRTKREAATSLPQWLDHAASYGSAFLACYGRLAAMAGRVPGAIDAAAGFGRHFGLIITIADDLQDYERCGEREGNLGHLILQGHANVAEVLAVLDSARLAALQAASAEPTAYDLAPVIEMFVADVCKRILPRLLSSAPIATAAAG